METNPSDPSLHWELDELATLPSHVQAPSRQSDVTISHASTKRVLAKDEQERSDHRDSESTIEHHAVATPQASSELLVPDLLGLEKFEAYVKAKRLSSALPKVNVVWKGLTVIGKQGKNQQGLPTFYSPLSNIASALTSKLNSLRKRDEEDVDFAKTILSNINGYARPGEMILVLGKPDSGASALMRTLGLQVKNWDVSGDISFNGVDSARFKKAYADQVVYSGDTDVHAPSLTPSQTLDVALAFRNPAATDEKEALMSWLGLEACCDTTVGNDWIRGISGGEKKRLTLAEVVACDAAVQVFDQTSKGLDSTYTHVVAQGLRVLTTQLEKATIAYFNQAGDNVYKLFDKVLVLSSGRCIYFGPTEEAKGYFENVGFKAMPRQSIPDFLTQVSEVHERRVKSGMEFLVPNTAAEFEQRWKTSDAFKSMLRAMENLTVDIEQFKQDTAESRTRKNPIGNAKSVYRTTPLQQFVHAIRREVLLLTGFKVVLAAKLVFNIVVALITAGFTFQMPSDGLGTYAKSGALFFSLLISAIQTTADVPGSVRARPIIYKQKAHSMYHPGMVFLAQVFCDVFFRTLVISVFSAIFYFMVGFVPSATNFFIYWISMILSALSFSAMSRALTAVSPNLNAALRLNGMWLIPCILFAGYMIPLNSIPPWLVWLFYLNPLAYAYKAMMVNEFGQAVIDCDGMIVPPYPQVPMQYKSCALPGNVAGASIVQGTSYLQARFDMPSDNWFMAWNILMLVVLWVVYLIVGAVAVEKMEFGGGGVMVQLFKRQAGLPTTSRSELYLDSAGVVKRSRRSLTWDNLSYYVKVGKQERQLLHGVSGHVQPGSLVALMGFTGAGKTTNFNVLCRRQTNGRVEGKIYVGDKTQDEDFNLISAYSQQEDIHKPTSTVREALQFSAYLRQPVSVAKHVKDGMVEQIIDLLEMRHIADALVGSVENGVGISLVDRKRLAIGIQLAATPAFLFLDEPTSALDSYAAFQIVRLLRNLADKGLSICIVVHQPSALLFDYFDTVALLGRGGRQLYFGPTGQTAIDYFERNGALPCPLDENPAEYLLEAANGLRNAFDVDWFETWSNSAECEELQSEISQMRSSGTGQADEKQRPAWKERFPIVLKRFFVGYYRNPSYIFGRIAIVVSQALFLALAFLNVGAVPNSVLGMTNTMFALFGMVTFGVATISFVLSQFFEEVRYYEREASDGFYQWTTFVPSLVLSELPFTFLTSVVFFAMTYFAVGLRLDMAAPAFYLLATLVFQLFCVSFGQSVVGFAPSLELAALISSLCTTIFPVTSGIPTPYKVMAPIFRNSLYWMSPYHYFSSLIMTTQFHELPIQCSAAELSTVMPPLGYTCSSYMSLFFNAGGPGYVVDGANGTCGYCPFTNGDQFLAYQLSWTFDDRWRDLAILCVLLLVNWAAICLWMWKRTRRA